MSPRFADGSRRAPGDPVAAVTPDGSAPGVVGAQAAKVTAATSATSARWATPRRADKTLRCTNSPLQAAHRHKARGKQRRELRRHGLATATAGAEFTAPEEDERTHGHLCTSQPDHD
ncbi:hypothetical protein GCM10010168_50340 [Actinoplanes ianthinogenes]|uniref:Uncharacterized protein n=1 Tax=Actinoplanes ianthinogenes TaxID=122358 RepID=A0ABN6CM60_9ACTN|nr:hypothetical protein Aiant_67430 [Actinoplanes ianthinogenes]GGR26119.1 hypothetical protein GCM10010168_50340 [Actinoplanes ianthinogenes]